MASKPGQSKEVMVTRFKSGKRRLRHVDRGVTLTKLLKSSERSKRVEGTKKSPTSVRMKGQKSPKSSSTKIGTANSKSDTKVTSIEEYYPNKLKRLVFAKKIVLKPNNNMKVVAKTSKRKLTTPHKGLKSPLPSPERSPRIPSPDLSVVDVIRIFEETQELDDEDLMEILTCPSPVWWEDPPDSTYVEDAICRRKCPDTGKERKKKQPQTKIENRTDIDINLQNKDVDFKKKRSKLEDLLNNLKVKVNGEEIGHHKNINEYNDVDTDRSESSKKQDTTAGMKNVKDTQRKSVKTTSTKVKNKAVIARKDNIRRIDEINVKNVGYARKIKIKTTSEINREVESKLAEKSQSNIENKDDTAIKEKINKDRLREENENVRMINSENQVVKGVEDSVNSDNTDLSEISISDELLRELENINIPIEDKCDPKDLESKNGSEIISNEQNETIESSLRPAKRKIISKKHIYDSNVECLSMNKPKRKKYVKKSNISVTPTKTKDTDVESKDIPTASTVTVIEGELNEDSLLNPDSQESFDSYDFDLEFENAILGLENTVLLSAKAKKRTIKTELNKKPSMQKVSIKNEKVKRKSPACFVKMENMSPKVRGKIKKESDADEASNDSKTSEPSTSNCKVRKTENVSQRGRIRRKKALFDYETDDSKNVDDKKDCSDESNIEKSSKAEKLEESPKKRIKRKQVNIPIKEAKKINRTEQKNIKTEKRADNKSISKRGRIRRLKVPFSHDKNCIPKRKRNKAKKSTPITTNPVKTDTVNKLSMKYVNSNTQEPVKSIRQYVNNKIKHIYKTDDEITPNDNTHEMKQTNDNINVMDKTNETKSNDKNEKFPVIYKILTDNANKVYVNEKATLQSAFTEFVQNRHHDTDTADSISDSCVKFIDDIGAPSGIKKNKSTKNDTKVETEKSDKETDYADKDVNVNNLGPNFRNVSPNQETKLENNEQLVLNTDSNKLVTVTSDKEVFDELDDLETITVYKIIPKDVE